MKRGIKAYSQGDLDYLCGVHAIINGLHAIVPGLTERQAQRLFRQLLEEIARRKPDPLQIVWRGIDASLMRHLLIFAANMISGERSVRVEVRQPFRTKKVRFNTFLAQLREHVSGGGVAIIGMRDQSSHWSVARKVTRKKIRLFDSYGRKSIPFKKCSLKAGKQFRIHAAETMLLRKVVEER